MDRFADKFLKALQDAMDFASAVIRKDGDSDKPYCIYSKTGKNLGCYKTKKAAQERLKEIEMFKHMDTNDD